MNFNSFEFLVFFPIVFLLYYVLPHKLRPAMLLLASYYFYMSWNPELVFLILGTTVISYFAGIIIDKYRQKKLLSKACLVIAVGTSLAVLFFFKYFNFVADTASDVANLFGANVSWTAINVILPVGISFYTFQTLSYVIDIYRNTCRVEKNFGYYALFVSFFPQLVAGPIERPENLIPQLREGHKLDAENIRSGLRLMAIGFFKKIVIADGVSAIVDKVYNAPDQANGLSLVIATVLFSVQIYGDFSGYTDIAIGCARMMGIRLMKNFNRPYTAQTIKEFWGRWHISLSTWFRDYLYIPLGGNRKGEARKLLNVFIVFLVSGIWHGAAMTFVLWGILHGLYRVVEDVFAPHIRSFYKKRSIDPSNEGLVLFRRIRTFVLVAFAWIFFRANSTEELWVLLGKLFTDWSLAPDFFTTTLSSIGLDWLTVLRIAVSVITLVYIHRIMPDNTYPAMPITQKRSGLVQKLAMVFLVLAIALGWIMLLSNNQTSSFIYFQF